ncbi:MAG: hypothetical protein M4579_006972 [Chaenotheca gracillima]|nr:MAG: hypothetical protein M4579_006972 [Chaenotheca gracillima]
MIQTTTIREMSPAFPRSSMPTYRGYGATHSDYRPPYEPTFAYPESNTTRAEEPAGRERSTNHRLQTSPPIAQSPSWGSGESPLSRSPSALPPVPVHPHTYARAHENSSAEYETGSSRTRGASSYPPSPLAGRPAHLAKPRRASGREQLPSLSQLLRPEPYGGLDSAAFSSHWHTAPSRERLSPRFSPVAGSNRAEFFGVRESPSSDPAAYRVGARVSNTADEPFPQRRSMSVAAIAPPAHSESTQYPTVTSSGWEATERRSPVEARSWSSQVDQPNDSRQQFPLGSHAAFDGSRHSMNLEQPLPKEPIGPSIWTGTHFLPRFVGERNVPGEGPCFFYDDGTHCKTIIDGEMVNAHWGVTKAGKPRKRLAVACLTCRDKKIKCDPDYPKCVQCEKFARICKFRNAPRGTRTSPDAYGYDRSESHTLLSAGTSASGDAQEDIHSSIGKVAVSPFVGQDPNITNGKRKSPSDSGRTTATLEQASDENSQPHLEHSSKRRRTFSVTSDQNVASASPAEAKSRQSMLRTGWASSSISEPPATFNWRVDPIDVDSGLVAHLMSLYFDHINSAAYGMFPRRPFLVWLETSKNKSPEDLMLIYSMLTVASHFSPHTNRHSFSRDFARISEHATAEHRGKYSLQLVQSRLLLALHYFALNMPTEAWDCSGAAFRATSGLNLNLEEPRTELPHQSAVTYGLTPSGYAECRRRTFWAAYMMDRYHAFYSGNALFFHDEDIFNLLPCDDVSFEEQRHTQAPFFRSYSISAGKTDILADSVLGPMVYLIHISSIWGKVCSGIYRTGNMPYDGYEERHEELQRTTQELLDQWKASLPEELIYSEGNLHANIRSGNSDVFVSMHTLYHMIGMKINRRVSSKYLGGASIRRNIRQATNHASELLQMMKSFVTGRESMQWRSRDCPKPVTGYAILLASDVLSAKGRRDEISGLVPLLQKGLAILEDMASSWSSASAQRQQLSNRIQDLERFAMQNTDENAQCFEMDQPMLGEIAIEGDLIYATHVNTYLAALAGGERTI